MSTQSETAGDLRSRVDAFLGLSRIAVAGVSRGGGSPANAIFSKLAKAGYDVVAINPRMASFGEGRCYPDLAAIPGGVEGLVIVTRPEVTEALVQQCPAAGVRHVWMHRSFEAAGSSVSAAAVAFCRENGIAVIAGACPMMFLEPDLAHRAMRALLRLTGGLPT